MISSCGDSEKWEDFGKNLKVELKVFMEELDVGLRKRGVMVF